MQFPHRLPETDNDTSPRRKLHDLPGWLRGRPEPGRRTSTGRRRREAARLARLHAPLAAVAREEGGEAGVDDTFAMRSHQNVGAWIMGRNMFGPVRGPWPDAEWRGWWGDDPPFDGPVFVLTHHARPSLRMEGGTVFHFVTGGIQEALDQARQAAGNKDVQISGGAATIRQYLRAGLIDELHIAISPILLGSGERLFEDLERLASGYECVQFVGSEKAAHMVLRRL